MARFDKLEARIERNDRPVDGLERPLIQDTDPPLNDFDEANLDYMEYREQGRPNREFQDRYYNTGFRNRVGNNCGRRGGHSGEGPYRGRGGRYQPRRTSNELRQNRARHNWDPPPFRQQTWGGDEQLGPRALTCWDSPQLRARFHQPNYDHPRGVKMDAPHFNGSDAANWVSRVQYYFEHEMIPEADRLHYVVMLFDPPASEWIFNYRANNEFVTWIEFLEDVRHRFDPQSFRNYTGLIAKLVQTGTVAEYYATFEKYLNHVEDLSETALIPIFIQGLKQPIQEKVELQQPASLAAVMALALRLAANQEEHQIQSSSFSRRQWSSRDNRYTPTALPSIAATAAAPIQTTPTTVTPMGEPDKFRVQPIRVSNAEKAERSRHGLCWHCLEKWVVGHVCKMKLLCYMDDDTDGFQVNTMADQSPGDEIITADLLHLHVLDDRGSSKPFIVHGMIDTSDVLVLIDTGATLDFLHPSIAEHLQLELTPIRPFRVLVGNGASLLCTHISRQTKQTMQGVLFFVDLHVLAHH